MSIQPPGNNPKPVLGLFSDEEEFRDYLADRLELIEPGLTRLKTEYELDNPDGVGGRIDILARDVFDHIVCIEIKRSDNSARGTLNELSKYITLLVERDRLPREMIRCIVVSTHWREVLLPLSYFAYSTGVDVTALQADTKGGDLALRPMPLKKLRFLPQLSPDSDLVWFEAAEPRESYVAFIKSRSPELPFVRLALLLFESKVPHDERAAYPMMMCIWRIADGLHNRIEAVIGKPIGDDSPYVAPGWEPESDAKDWLGDVPPDQIPEVANGWTHGTPEKLHVLQRNYKLSRIERIGDWPKLEFINNDNWILKAALATSPLEGSERTNRHSYRATVTPRVSTSWKMAADAFLDFIAFEPVWQPAVRTFFDQLSNQDVSVDLHAFDKRHLVYAIHQARFHKDTMLSYFEIIVRANDAVLDGLHGHYTWDGKTCPSDAEISIRTIYGDVVWARLSIGSAVDNTRYEQANALHGFLPVIDRLNENGSIQPGPPLFRYSIQDFVKANDEYSQQVSEVLEEIGSLPTDPSS